MRTGNNMRAALALAATAITDGAEYLMTPSRAVARSRTGRCGKGKRRAKNKAARKMRKQQRRQS